MVENAQATGNGAVETDYKALYEQTLARAELAEADRDKQKKQKDSYATENAEYKRQEADRKKKELESLPELEKLRQEYQASVESNKNYEAELNKLKTEKAILANGFTAEESEILIKGGCPIELVKPLAEILKARTTELEKTIKAQLLKETTQPSPMGNGTVGKEKTGYQEYEESRQVGTKEVKLK